MGDKGYKEFVKRFEDVCTQYADKTAITYMRDDGSKTLFTFGEIMSRVKAAKEQFAGIGLRPGDRAAIIAPQSPFSVITAYALAYANITGVHVDAGLPAEELNRLLDYSDIRAVFTVPKIYEELNKPLISDIPIFDFSDENEDYRVFDSSAQKVEKAETIDPSLDVIAILFSSGTTASVKGVMIGYQAVNESLRPYLLSTGQNSDWRVLFLLPLSHVAGFFSVFVYIQIGSETGMIEDVNASKFAQGLQDYQPTAFLMVPRVFEVIEGKISQEIHGKGIVAERLIHSLLLLSGLLRKIFGVKIGKTLLNGISHKAFGNNIYGLATGTTPIKDSTTKFYLNLGLEWANFYSTTETFVPTVNTGLFDRYPVGTVGKADRYDGIDIKIADPDENGIGEIRVKTVLIMKGYFRDPEATAAAFDEYGYFKTGDLGYIDRKGYLHVTGRIKEAILLHTGKKVAPTDVDALYSTVNPDIPIASCGVPSRNECFDEIHLFIESAGLSEEEQQKIKKDIMDFSGQTSTIYQISGIHFIDKLPTTSVGKVKRFKLKEIALEKRTSK